MVLIDRSITSKISKNRCKLVDMSAIVKYFYISQQGKTQNTTSFLIIKIRLRVDQIPEWKRIRRVRFVLPSAKLSVQWMEHARSHGFRFQRKLL